MRLPVDVRDLIKSGSQIREEREKPVRIAVFVEVDAPDGLIDVVRSRFRPYTPAAKLHIEVVEPDSTLSVEASADAVIGLAGHGGVAFADSVADARERSVPVAVLGLAEDPVALCDALGHPYRDCLVDPDPERLVDVELGDWLVDRLPSKRLALAHNFEFMRRAVAVEHVKNTAFQNALVGAIAIIPGADMPIMTANQAKMVLQIAAAYGEEVSRERARELLGVIGGAFVFRTIARQAVAFVPGFGWAIKSGIGYTGTIAMGYAAVEYFERGADLGDLKERLETYGVEMMSKVRELSHRGAGTGAEPPALASAGEGLPAERLVADTPEAGETAAGGS